MKNRYYPTHKFAGARPLCARCKKREATAYVEGSLCESCKTWVATQKKKAVETLKGVFEIANGLKKNNRDAYGEIFAWINGAVKRGMAVGKVARVIEIAAKNAEQGKPPRELLPYLNGVARSLEGEKAATELRAGEKNWVSDILGQAMRGAEDLSQRRKGAK